MGYRWMSISGSTFDRSLPISKIRWNTNGGSFEGWFTYKPNQNCDGGTWWKYWGANNEEMGYPTENRFDCNATQFSDKTYNFYDEKFYSHTHTTPVEDEVFGSNCAEFECTTTRYWGGIMNGYDYANAPNCFRVYAYIVEFEPSKSVFQFNSLGGSESFTIEATTGWTATTASDWVSLSQTTGTTGGTLVLTCNPNASDSARTATITFTDADANTFDITINQKKRGVWIPKAKVRKGALIVSKEYWNGSE